MRTYTLLITGLIVLPLVFATFFYFLGFLNEVINPSSQIKFPSVLDIYSDFLRAIVDKDVIRAIGITLKNVIISTLISIFTGVFLSLLLTANKNLLKIFEPTVDLFRSIPVTFFIPAFALILGVSSPNIIWILTIIPCSLIIVINVTAGITQQNKARLHHFCLLSRNNNRFYSFFKITVFEVLPFLVSGIKIILSYSIVVVTVLEYMKMGSQIGLGNLVADKMDLYDYKRVYSIILIVGLIGYIVNKSVNVIFNKRLNYE